MKTYPQWLNVMLLLALLLPIAGHPTAAALSEDIPTTSQVAAPVAASVDETLRNSPVMFIENVGQFDDGARFQVRGGNGTLWLADDALWITIVERSTASDQPSARFAHTPESLFNHNPEAEIQNRQIVNLRLSFPNANPNPRLEPFERLETTVSYFLGNDPDGWRPAVPVWGGVRYVDLYPGIDLEVTSEGGQFVQRLHTRPGADLSQVKMRVEGAEAVELAGTDGLRLRTAVGAYTLPLLAVADVAPDARPEISAVKAATFDIMLPFTLSPRYLVTSSSAFQNQDSSSHLLYGTFLGGSGSDFGGGIAVDGAGAAYVTGVTWSSDFPTTPGTFDTDYNGDYDAFVVKVARDGSDLAYTAFLGGSRYDKGYGIAVNGSGEAYVVGETRSANFSTTPSAFDTTYNGEYDAFVVKVASDGSVLAYSTFLGASYDDYGYGIAVDSSGAAYVTGQTFPSNFPTTPGAFDTTPDNSRDSYVVKLAPDGSTLAYSTFLGGSNKDYGYGIAVDGKGAAYITGETWSSDFPTTLGAFDTTYNGGYYDAYVVKVAPDGSALAYAAFLGGSHDDVGMGIAVDGNGAAYVTGNTPSFDFPTTPGTFDATYNGRLDAFVVKVVPDGSTLAYSTFLGGSNNYDVGRGIAVARSGAAYVTGWTGSSDFPTIPDAFTATHNGGMDAFVVKLNADGSGLAYSTFLGGNLGDYGYAIGIDRAGAAYVTGYTVSSDFPTTPGAFDIGYNGDGDAFVVKLDVGTISEAIPSGLLTLLSTEAISPFRPLVITAQVDNAGLAQQEFDLAFHLWHDNTLVDTQFFVLPVNSGAMVVQAANFGLRAIGRYRVEAVLAAAGATLATQSRDIIVVDAYAARIILDYAGDLQAAAHAELDDIAYVPSYALSDEIVSLGLDKLQDYAIGKFADLAAPIQEAGDLPLSTSDGAIAEIQDKLGRVRQYRRNLASAIRLYVSDMYDVTLPAGFDPLNPDLDSITDPVLKDRIKNWLNEYIAVFLSDNIVSPLWVNGPRNDVDDRHLAFEDFLLSHPVAAEPGGLAGQMQRGRERILNVVEGDALITLGPYDVLGQTLQYDLTLQEQENKRQQIHTFDDILKIIIPVLVIIGVVIIVLLIIGAISSSGVLAAVVGPIIWKIVKILHAISKIVPMATALLAVSMLFTASIVAPHVPQYHDETLDAAEMLIGSSGLAWLHNFDVAVRSGQAQLTVQVDGPEVGESQVLVETVLYSVDGRIIHIVWSPLQIQAGQQALLSKDVPLVPGVYRAVTTLYAEGEVAAAETVPFQMSGPSVELDLHLNQSHLNPGDLVAATITLTNTSPISDVNDLTLIVESTDGVNFDAWPITLMAGGTQQINYTFTPTTTGACVLRAWLGIGFNTLAQQDVAYTVGGGPAVALNTHVAEVYLPGAAITLPLTLTNVGDTADTVSITIQTNDRLQTGVVFSATQLITVPADSMVFAGTLVLPNAEPGLYSVWLMMNGAAYDAYDFAVSATNTLFGLLTLGELYAQIGQNVPVTATVHTAGNVLTDATIIVTIQSPNGTAAILPMTWVSSGTYRADYIPPITGTYSLELAVTRAGHRTVGDRSFFVVGTPTLLIPTVEGQPQAREIRPITVTVYNENGTPVQGAMVVLSGTEEILRGETDETGHVLLRTFPPDVRPYVLATEKMGYAGATTEVAVAWFQIYLPLVLRQ